ncbi:MAG TPA: response regulator transcription factor [Pseudonocardiaceae bacterium]|jgi:DNA-binding NarL/FixJ family response regulator
MSATLTLTAGSGPATIASKDPRAAYLFGAVTTGRSVSSASCAATLRCLIVDDSPRFLHAARGLLERQGIMVVGVASTSAEALQQAIQLRPDIALLGINLGGESGFDLARRLFREARLAPCRMILISTHAEQDYADLIAASPVLGFIPESALSADVIRAHRESQFCRHRSITSPGVRRCC